MQCAFLFISFHPTKMMNFTLYTYDEKNGSLTATYRTAWLKIKSRIGFVLMYFLKYFLLVTDFFIFFSKI